MRKPILIALAVVISIAVWTLLDHGKDGDNAAAGWIKIAATPNATTFYANPAVIRKKGHFVKLWVIVDYKAEQEEGGRRYNSMRIQTEYNCKEKMMRRYDATFYSGNMSGGNGFSSASATNSKWFPVTPESPPEALLKYACGKK